MQNRFKRVKKQKLNFIAEMILECQVKQKISVARETQWHIGVSSFSGSGDPSSNPG